MLLTNSLLFDKTNIEWNFKKTDKKHNKIDEMHFIDEIHCIILTNIFFIVIF